MVGRDEDDSAGIEEEDDKEVVRNLNYGWWGSGYAAQYKTHEVVEMKEVVSEGMILFMSPFPACILSPAFKPTLVMFWQCCSPEEDPHGTIFLPSCQKIHN